MTMWYLITGEVVVLLGTLLQSEAHQDMRLGPAFAAAMVSVLLWPLLIGSFVVGVLSTLRR